MVPDSFTGVDHGLQIAEAARSRGDWAEAIECCTRAIAQWPAETSLRLQRARFLSETKRWGEALDDFLIAAEGDPAALASWLGGVHCLRSLKRADDALKLVHLALTYHPNQRNLRLISAELNRDVGQWDAAEADFRDILASFPGDHAAHIGLASCVRRREGLAVALGHYEAALSASPHERWPKLALAEALRELGRLGEAIPLYESLLLSAPRDPQALLGLAICTRRRDGASAALAIYEAAFQVAPNDLWARLGLADALLDLGRLNEAESHYAALLTTNPEFRQACMGRAACIRRREGLAKALPHYEVAAAIKPRDRWSDLVLADAYRELGQLDQAFRLYADTIEAEPSNASARAGIARCINSMQGALVSIPYFRDALDLRPDDQWLRCAFAEALRDGECWDEAETEFRILADRFPSLLQAHMGIAACLRHKGDTESAIPHLEQALSIAPGQRWPRMALADARRELGRWIEAEQLYWQLTIDDPRSHHGWMGLAACAKARFSTALAYPYLEAALFSAPQERWVRASVLDALRDLGRLDEAITRARMWLLESPDDARLNLSLGRLVRMREGLDASMPLFEAALESAHGDLAVTRECAALLRDAGSIDRALALYSRLQLEHPRDVHIKLGAAQCAFLASDRRAALCHLHEVAASCPRERYAVLEAARIARDWGELELARQFAVDFLDRTARSNAEVWISLAQTMSKFSSHDAAAAAYREALKLAPSRHELWLLLAHVQRAAGDLRSAEVSIIEAKRLAAASSDMLARIAQHHIESLEHEEALSMALEAYDAVDRGPLAAVTLVHALVNVGEVPMALGLLDDAIEQFGSRPEFYMVGSSVLRSMGNLDAAREAIEACIELDSVGFGKYLEAFRIELSAGNLVRAADRLGQVRAASALEAAEISFCLGALAEAQWDYRVAISHYRAVLGANPQHIGAHRRLATYSMMIGDLRSAREHVRAFTELEVPQRLARGLPLNASQSHLGQLLDEYQIDPETVDRLQAVAHLDPFTRISALVPMQSRMSEHTPTAIALLVAIRESGLFSGGCERDAESRPIPRRIAQFWDSPEIPPDLADLMESWERLNPGYAYFRFDETSARAFIAANCEPAVEQAFVRASEPAMKSDLFRLAWLSVNGGFYADADDRALVPIGDFLPPGTELLLSQENSGPVGNNFIGATERHPVIVSALSAGVAAINQGGNESLWLSTGPGLLSRCLAAWLADSPEIMQARLGRLTVFTDAELARNVRIHCAAAYKKTKRHWMLAAIEKKRSQRERAATADGHQTEVGDATSN